MSSSPSLLRLRLDLRLADNPALSDQPLPAPKQIVAPDKRPKSLPLDALALAPQIKWAEGLRAAWHPGESGARAQLDHFLSKAFTVYSEQRNRPDIAGTSRLSPHLHFGEIGPRQIWHRRVVPRERPAALVKSDRQ